MQPFCFSIKAVPTRGSLEHAGIKVAIVIVFVISEDVSCAERLAIGHVLDQGWMVEAVEARLSPTPQQIARLDTDMQALLRKAQKHGIAAIFAGVQRDSGHSALVEIRPLLQPSFVTDPKSKPN